MPNRRFAFAAPFILVAACHHGGGTTTPQGNNNFATWSVMKQGDSCQAFNSSMSCPKDASCNPPAPMTIACPDGLMDGAPMTVVQPMQGGECWTQPPDGTAPSQITCPHED